MRKRNQAIRIAWTPFTYLQLGFSLRLRPASFMAMTLLPIPGSMISGLESVACHRNSSVRKAIHTTTTLTQGVRSQMLQKENSLKKLLIV